MFQSQSKMVVAVGRMRLFMHSIRAIICFYISLMCFKLERNFKLYSFFFAFFDFDATLIDHPPPPQYRPLSVSSSPPQSKSQSQSQEIKPSQDNCVNININADISSTSGTVQTLGLPGHDHGISSSSLLSLLPQQQQLYHPFGSILEEEEELEESGPRDELWEISSSSGVNEFDDDGVGDEDTMWMHHHQQRHHPRPHDEAMSSGDHLKKLNALHRNGSDIMSDVYVGLDLNPKLGRTSNPTSKPTSKAITPPTGSELGLIADSDCDAVSLASPLICATDFAVYKEEYDYHIEVSNCNKKKATKVIKDRSNPSSVVRRHLTFSSSPKLTWVEGGLNSLTNSEIVGNEEEEEEECEEFEGGRDSDDDIVPSVGSWETLSERSSEPPTTICFRSSHSSSTTTTTSSRNRWWKQLWPTTFSVSCTSKTSAKVSPTRLLSSCSERFLSCSDRVTAFDTRGVSTPGFDTKHHHHHHQHHNQHQNHNHSNHLRSKSFVTSTTNNLGGNSSRPVSPRKSFDGGHHADHHHQQARLSTTSKWFQKDFAHGHTSFTRRSASGSGSSSSSSSHHSNSAVDHLSVSNWNEFPGLGAMNFQGCRFSVPSSASSSWDARGINGGEEDVIRRLVKGSRGSGITVADLLMHEFDE